MITSPHKVKPKLALTIKIICSAVIAKDEILPHFFIIGYLFGYSGYLTLNRKVK